MYAYQHREDPNFEFLTESSIKELLEAAAKSGIDNIRGSTRFNDRTGNLRNVQRVSVSLDSLRFTSPLEYASFVNNGRGPVRPIKAKVLHWRAGGQSFFRTESGPAAPRPFFDDATQQIERFLQDHLDTAIIHQ